MQINTLCASQTKLNVLNPQFSYMMQGILGSQFTNPMPDELQNQFPKEDSVFEFENIYKKESAKHYHQYTNRFTKEVLEFPTARFDPISKNREAYEIKSVR